MNFNLKETRSHSTYKYCLHSNSLECKNRNIDQNTCKILSIIILLFDSREKETKKKGERER